MQSELVDVDLSDKVGAITVKDAIVALENHEPTDGDFVSSRSHRKEVRDEVVQFAAKYQQTSRCYLL